MQGWRKTMEDTAVHKLLLGPEAGASLFAVFDGHGSNEISDFCREHLVSALKNTDGYWAKDYG